MEELSSLIANFNKEIVFYYKLVDNNVVEKRHLTELLSKFTGFITQVEIAVGDSNELLSLLIKKGKSLTQIGTEWTDVPRPNETSFSVKSRDTLKKKLGNLDQWIQNFEEVYKEEMLFPRIDEERLEKTLPLITELDNVENHLRQSYQKILEGKYTRNAIDDARLAFENSLRQIVSNKSLEKNTAKPNHQFSNLEKFLSEHNVSPSLMKIIQEFAKNIATFNDKGIKHQGKDVEKVDFNSAEARFLLFSTLEIIVFIKSLKT